ncbi:MAG: AAA family ATPase [Prevotella sp.]|nr:AAA family ATPase [Prevotella sp.]
MGIYIDKGNSAFKRALNSEYVDKSGLIAVVNKTLFTEYSFTCVTRCRRFGKSMAARMLAAYYDRSCDSRPLFEHLQIASNPTFEEHLNKYPVIYCDLSSFTRYLKNGNVVELMEKALITDIAKSFPDIEMHKEDTLMDYLLRIHAATGDTFIFIIDEWDAILRECAQDPKLPDQTDDYVSWLRSMFKDVLGLEVFAGVYMTGILPIKKYCTQSAMNNFLEYSMIEPGNMASFFGFTKDEVQALATKHQMSFEELEKWYDGYQIGPHASMFNPNSVMQAVTRGRCRSFWATTGAFDSIASYIKMNFDGLKNDIVEMLAGGRAKVNTTKFRNDLSDIRSRDDVLTVLIHLGYLAFDWERRECYVPNYEVSEELANAVEETGWTSIVQALQQSEQLLEATLRGDEQTVARMVAEAHTENASIIKYSDENSMACVLAIAYYYAHADYIFHREFQTGLGFADLVLIPRKNTTTPAIIVELKYNDTVGTAIDQIHQRHYPEKVAQYTGNILLVAISYDKKTKEHLCRIEKLPCINE